MKIFRVRLRRYFNGGSSTITLEAKGESQHDVIESLEGKFIDWKVVRIEVIQSNRKFK